MGGRGRRRRRARSAGRAESTDPTRQPTSRWRAPREELSPGPGATLVAVAPRTIEVIDPRPDEPRSSLPRPAMDGRRGLARWKHRRPVPAGWSYRGDRPGSRTTRRTIAPIPPSPTVLALSDDGRLLAGASGSDGVIRVWSTSDGLERARFASTAGASRTMAWSAVDGRLLTISPRVGHAPGLGPEPVHQPRPTGDRIGARQHRARDGDGDRPRQPHPRRGLGVWAPVVRRPRLAGDPQGDGPRAGTHRLDGLRGRRTSGRDVGRRRSHLDVGSRGRAGRSPTSPDPSGRPRARTSVGRR